MKKLLKHLPGVMIALALVIFLASGNGLEVSATPTGTPWNGETITESGTYYLDIPGDTLQMSEQNFIYCAMDVTIDLNGKTIQAPAAGRCFYVTGELTIKNGTIIGSGTALSGSGGIIYVDDGTFTLESGLITGGKATSRGGNIYATKHSIVNISGGSVTNGEASEGGNIGTMYSTLVVSGGSIANGSATYGDNIWVSGSAGTEKGSSTLLITGGEVDAGNQASAGVSIYATGSSTYGSVVQIFGGTLRGETFMKYIKSCDLSGAPVIEDLHLADGMLVTPGALSGTASITVQTDTASKAITGTLTNAESVVQYFHAEAGQNVTAVDGVLVIGQVCPCCNTATSNITWTTVTSSTTFSTGGHYKLTGAVTLSAEKTIPAGQNVTIDLCGNTLTAATGARCFTVKGTLNIIDSGASGTITGGSISGARGGNILVSPTGTLHVYDGTVTGGSADRGGNIASEGKTYIHGGIVQNGTASSASFGHNIYVQYNTGTLYITGGTVAATTDGNASILSMYSTIDISGGTIEGGISVSGASSQYSTLRISGGTINGNVTASGAIANKTAPEVVISGGTLNGITTVNAARIFSLSGAPTINQLNLGAGVLIAPSQLSANANITTVNATGVFTVPLTNGEAYKTWFAGKTTKTVEVHENALMMYNGTGSTSGTSGNISWTLTSDGVLLISGTGSMTNYGTTSSPWYSSRTNIKAVVIQSGVTSIGNYAFNGCSNLKSVDIAGTVGTISSSAFSGCSLDSVQFRGTKTQWANIAPSVGNASVKTYGSVAVSSNISWQVSGGTLTISGTGAMPNYYYDSELTNYVGTPWKDQANQITSVVIESGVTTVGSWAFYDLENLTSVTIPGTIETIRQGAFARTALQTVNYQGTENQWNAITVESNNAPLINATFTYAVAETVSIVITTPPTDTAYYIGETLDTTGLVVTATYENGTTDEITQGYQLTYDFSTAGTKTVTVTYEGKTATFQVTVYVGGACGAEAFWTLDNGVVTISGTGAMANYSSAALAPWSNYTGQFTSVVIGEDITAIGSYAFSGCTNLTDITISADVAYIGENAFSGCTGLTNLRIPFVQSIGTNAFAGCTNLKVYCRLEQGADENCSEALSAVTVRYIGDVNGDNAIDYNDYLKLVRHLKDETIVVDEEAADVNGSGTVDTNDYLKLVRYLKDETILLG